MLQYRTHLDEVESEAGAPLVGLFPGAGIPAALAAGAFASLLITDQKARLRFWFFWTESVSSPGYPSQFPPSIVILDQLTIPHSPRRRRAWRLFVQTTPVQCTSQRRLAHRSCFSRQARSRKLLPLGDHHRVIYSSYQRH